MAALVSDYHTWLKPQRDGSYSFEQIARLLQDAWQEPRWRQRAELEEEFYDGNQLDTDTLRRMRENGIPPLSFNKIAPIVDNVIGFEERSRTDLLVMAENDQSFEGAEALNQVFKTDLRITGFNDHAAFAFKNMVRAGIGWMEVAREDDPWLHDYRVAPVDWREMWWDFRARRDDLSDARWILRRLWFDGDVLASQWPKHAELIRYASNAWPDTWFQRLQDDSASHLRQAFQHEISETSHSLEELEWRDTYRQRIALYEILYRVPKMATVMELSDGMKIEFDRSNPNHVEAVEYGTAKLKRGPTTRWRQAFYVGPHRLQDDWTEFNQPHYIPFIFKREAKTRSPYGLVRHMISPQEDINARRTKILYNLSSQRAYVEEDAVDDHQMTAQNLMRKDAYIVVNKNRANLQGPGITVESGTDTNQAEFALLELSQNDMHMVSGIYPEFGGQQSKSGQSGRVFDGLVGEGEKVLGNPLRNYGMSRERAGTLLLAMRTKDMGQKDNQAIMLERGPMRRSRTIMLNGVVPGEIERSNDILRLQTRIALGEFPATVTYREQKFAALAEIVKSMPPELQGMMMDLVVQASNVPNQEAILDRIRQATGFGPEPTDPQEMQALAEQRARQQEMEARDVELQFQEREAVIAKMHAEAALALARAHKTEGPDIDFTEAKTLAELVTLAELEKDSIRKDVDMQARVLEAGTRLLAESRKPKVQPTARKPAGKKLKKAA